jgi:hypothetical protein
MTSVRRVTLACAALALAASAVLTGCSTSEAGAAATFSNGRISDADLTEQVAEILEAKGQSASTTDPRLVQQTLGRMITQRLIAEMSAEEGVEITQGTLDEMRKSYEAQIGGADALAEAFLAENVAPSQINALLLLQMQAQELGYVFSPRGSAEEQGQAVFIEVGAYSQAMETTVSPRYGTWDPQTLSLGPVPTDLSMPPALD